MMHQDFFHVITVVPTRSTPVGSRDDKLFVHLQTKFLRSLIKGKRRKDMVQKV